MGDPVARAQALLGLPVTGQGRVHAVRRVDAAGGAYQLVCVDGRSHEEASAILGAPEGTIAWRVHEARRKLREFMAERGFDPEET